MPYNNKSVDEISSPLRREIAALEKILETLSGDLAGWQDESRRTQRLACLAEQAALAERLRLQSESQLLAFQAAHGTLPPEIQELCEKKRSTLVSATNAYQAATDGLRQRKDELMQGMVNENLDQRVRMTYRK